jgi:hypothetical protein
MANPNPKPPPVHSRFKKGQVANPEGGRAHKKPIDLKLRKLTLETYREIIELVLAGDRTELIERAKDPKTPALEAGIITSVLKAIKNGDYSVIERIAERIIGKIPDVVKVQSTGVMLDGANLPIDMDAVRAAVKKLEEDV